MGCFAVGLLAAVAAGQSALPRHENWNPPAKVGYPDWVNFDEPVDMLPYFDGETTYIYVGGMMTGLANGTVYTLVRYDPDNHANDPKMATYGNPTTFEGTCTPTAMAVDVTNGDVYITGSTGTEPNRDYLTVKFNYNTQTEDLEVDTSWGTNGAVTYDGEGEGDDVAVDVIVYDEGESKRVIVTGTSDSGEENGGDDIVTIAYYPDDGDTEWIGAYNGPGNGHDKAVEMAALRIAGGEYEGPVVVVAGEAYGGDNSGFDLAAICYNDNSGTPYWYRTYTGPVPGNEVCTGIAYLPDAYGGAGTPAIAVICGSTPHYPATSGDTDYIVWAIDVGTGDDRWDDEGDYGVGRAWTPTAADQAEDIARDIIFRVESNGDLWAWITGEAIVSGSSDVGTIAIAVATSVGTDEGDIKASHTYDADEDAGLSLALGAVAAPSQAQCVPGWTSATVGHQGVLGMATHDEDGPGPIPRALYAGVNVTVGTETSWNIGRFDGWKWYTLGPGLGAGSQVVIITQGVFDNGGARVPGLGGLVVGGNFGWSGQRRLSHGIATWDGGTWGGVAELLAAGSFQRFAVYEPVQGGPDPPVLLGAGLFRLLPGIPPMRLPLQWDGLAWTTFAGGVSDGAGSFTWFDEDGTGPLPAAFFAAGGFYEAGGVFCVNIARWSGTQWSSLGGFGPRGGVGALCVFDEDGGGPLAPALFVGGTFSDIGAPNNWWLPTNGGLARWDGTQWSTVAGWDGGNIDAMTVFDDDGPGPNKPSLFVTGMITRVQGTIVNGIARWDGQQWYGMGGMGGLLPQVGGKVMAVFDEDGPGPNPGGLYVGGEFFYAGGLLTPGLARWGCPLAPRCEDDCDTTTGPGVLDIFDFLCFQNRCAARDPWACDCDITTGARVCDIFDFLCFQNAYAAGCP